MTHELNIKQSLATPEIQRFEKRMSEKYGRQVALRDVPLKNFVDVDENILETKVSQLFLRGAGEAAGFWPELISIVNMTSPIQEVPIVSQRDFVVRTGKMSGAALEEAGGKISRVRLDTTDDHHIRYVHLKIDQQDVKLQNFDLIEKSIMAAGAAFSKNILNDVTSHYDGVSGNTQALSTDTRFVAIAKLLALIADDGFEGNVIMFEANDFVQALTEETTGGTMPWLLGIPTGQPLGDNFGKGVLNGFVGRYMSKIPVFSIANEGGMGTGEIMIVDKEAASVLGFAPGGQIALSQEIRKMQDIVDSKIQAKYAIANGNANAVGAVTGV